MGFENFRLNVAARVLLLFGLIAIAIWSATHTTWQVTPVVCGILAVVLMVELVRYVESVNRELAEFIFSAREPDSVRKRSVRGLARGVRDARQRGDHPAGEQPSAEEAEHQQERHRDGRGWRVGAQEERTTPGDQRAEQADDLGRQAPEQAFQRCAGRTDEPGGDEHQQAGQHEEPGVAERQLEADARPGLPIHARLDPDRVRRRCGSRRRRRWR